MCDPVTAILGVASLAAGVMQGNKAEKSAEKASASANQNAKDSLAQNEREQNRLNAKAPDVAGIISGNERAAKGAGGGTMLTGPSGVDPGTLALGKNTLLGTI